MKTVIFAAGGTAGHLFMARGIAHYLDCKKILITDIRGEKYAGDVFDEVHVLPISSSHEVFFKYLSLSWKVHKILSKYEKAIFIGCGAYVSVVVGAIAYLKRIPIYIYQADLIMGRANKILSYLAKKVFLLSKDIAKGGNYIEVGLVSRPEIIAYPINLPNIQKALSLNSKQLKIEHFRIRILIMAGSLGSDFWTKIIIESLGKLSIDMREEICILQQGESEALSHAYLKLGIACKFADFIDTAEALPWSNLVIARAGISTIADLYTSMRPALLIPWAKALNNHQVCNAKWASKNIGIDYVEEKDFTAEFLSEYLKQHYANNEIALQKSIAMNEYEIGGLQIRKELELL